LEVTGGVPGGSGALRLFELWQGDRPLELTQAREHQREKELLAGVKLLKLVRTFEGHTNSGFPNPASDHILCAS